MPIHPTAIIDPRAEIDPGATIGPNCVIDENVRIGPGCRLYQNVYVTGWTEIAADCELHPGVIVGHAPQDVKYSGQRTYCRIGRGTVLREYVTIHRGTTPESQTVVGEECFILCGTHVGHNCAIGDRVTLINNTLLAGHVQVAERATLGGAVGVHQFVRIGELVMIAGCARVVQDIPPFTLIGVDGHVSGLNRVGMRRAGMTREEIDEVRTAYRILYGPGGSFRAAVDRLAQSTRSAAAEKILEFVQGDSKKGIAGRSRRRTKSAEDD